VSVNRTENLTRDYS